ncbi:MAG: nucleotidyltransferase [Halobacteriales archaeon]|nr:nucleotidyltransferase [Halobacteriales archaeon]
MELDEAAQRDVLRRIAEAAARHGLMVAPVGSVYFLLEGERSLRTKDVDVVVHDAKGSIASLDMVTTMAEDLGHAEVAHDKASVKVTIQKGGEDIEIDLLRGRPSAKGGFLPRELLEAAGEHAKREGAVLWYPYEYVLLLKAEAAVDRARRAEKQDAYTEDNRRRAEAFRADVKRQMDARLRTGHALRADLLEDGIRRLKENRRRDVAALLEAASGGKLRLRV